MMKHHTRHVRALTTIISAVMAVAVLSSCQQQADDSEDATVRFAQQPIHQYAAWTFAEESGMAAELGLELEFSWVPQVDTGVQSVARGDFELASSCPACNLPYLEQTPGLRDGLIISQFKGFILVGPPEAPAFDELVASGATEEEARAEIYDYIDGRSFVLRESTYGALVDGLLEQADLTRDDVTVIDMADEARAAQAYLQGEGDFYMGSLAQETKLLREHPDRAVNLGGTEILGPGGLWYDSMAFDATWLDDNEDTRVKLAALWARVARYVNERPDDIIPHITTVINENSGSTFSEEEIGQIVTEFLDFATLESWEEDIFNPESELYWRNSLDFYVKQNLESGVLPDSVDIEKHFVAETTYEMLVEDEDLISWINEPLT